MKTLIIKKFFYKRLVTKYVPEKNRIKLVNTLFKNFVSKNFKKFHKELYMSVKQIRNLKNNGSILIPMVMNIIIINL